MISDITTSNYSNDEILQLQRERTDYKFASQVRTAANCLIQLSVGIYSEPERFVYELLQNAVDAFADTGNESLEILIKADQEKIVFMHNGKPFTIEDVKGICDVGNGTKAKDSKKIGYKGIGFKSVFMPSVNKVSIISGQYCFEFDKQKALSLISYDESEGVLGPDDIPWQNIPISAPHLNEQRVTGFNVITIVYTQEANKIGDKVKELFSDLQFLLFLRGNNVNIRFEKNGQQIFSVGKKKQDVDPNDIMQKVTLYKNDRQLSTWMLYSKEILVPSDVKDALQHDFNTPDKLKGTESVEISFAVQTKKNKVVRLENTSVFTFLPTSYRALQQPFLINSNFITDSSRQQLHQGSEWNKLIFENIPKLYLEFVASFSRNDSNYTEVLPKRPWPTDTLSGVFKSALESTLDKVAFVPDRSGKGLLRIGDVLVDKTGASTRLLSPNTFVSFVNKKKGTHYTKECLVGDPKIISYAQDKVRIFDSGDLLDLINDDFVTNHNSVKDYLKLIRFLFDYSHSLSSPSFDERLSFCSFLPDDKNELRKPIDLFFPSSYREENSQASDVLLLNDDIYNDFKQDEELKSWLSALGVRELNNCTFLDYIIAHPDHITTENAIEIGRFIFDTWKKCIDPDKSSYASKIKGLNFLSKDGTLQPLCNLYLGSLYSPEDDIEHIYPEKCLFISDAYGLSGDVEDWAYFLKKCGIGYRIGIVEKWYQSSRINDDILIEAAESFSHCDHKYKNYRSKRGHFFANTLETIQFGLYYFSFVNPEQPNFEFDRYIFTRVLSQDRDIWETKDEVIGYVPFFNDPIEKKLFDFTPDRFSKYHSYLEYALANKQKFPTTMGTCENPKDVFINYPSIIELCGKYLPVLAIDTSIDESWKEILPFKQNLSIKDLLIVLDRISVDKEEETDSKKERISRIYREIIDRDEQCSDKIKEWAKAHRILEHSGKFLPPEELSFITVDGVKNKGSKVYCEKVGLANREKMLQLLKTLGVQVITQKDMTTDFSCPVEDNNLKTRLLNKVQYLALLCNAGEESLDKRKTELESKIQKAHFYRCDSISLTFQGGEGTISKSTFSLGDSFYYTGRLTSTLIEPLLPPLCSLLELSISNDKKLLAILTTDDHQSLCDYLSGFGYDVSKLIDSRTVAVETPVNPGKTTATQDIAISAEEKIVNNRGNLDEASQKEINKEVRIRAKRYLEANGYDVSQWEPETSQPDVVGIIKDSGGNTINVIIRSARQHDIHLSASSFETLMTNPNNLLLVENQQGIRSVTFEELFGNDSNVNLIFDANQVPLDYFQSLATIFKNVKNSEFVVKDPHYSAYDEIKGFCMETKNEGNILIASTDDF